jgi:hypothetical protein
MEQSLEAVTQLVRSSVFYGKWRAIIALQKLPLDCILSQINPFILCMVILVQFFSGVETLSTLLLNTKLPNPKAQVLIEVGLQTSPISQKAATQQK